MGETKQFERRQQPRYPVAQGYLEIAGRTLKVDNVSEDGVGFYTDAETPLPEGEVHEGFLVLQHEHDQFEIPVGFEVRRREENYVGARTVYKADYHRNTVVEFIEVSDGGNI